MLLARYAAPGSHHHGTSLISVSARGCHRIFPVSKSVGPKCEGRKLNVYRFITLKAMRKRHKNAVQDWVVLI
jgi:hypothetical protein